MASWPFPHGDPCGIFGSTGRRAGSRILCGTGFVEPTGTPQSGESTKLIPIDRGVMVGESWVDPEGRQLANAFSALDPRAGEEACPMDAMHLALRRG